MRLGRRAVVAALTVLLLGVGAAPAVAAAVAPASPVLTTPADPEATDPEATDPETTDPEDACLTQGTDDGYAPPGRCELVIASATAVCLEDVPYLQYDLDAYGTPNTTTTITWVNPSGQSVVMSGLPLSGQVVWPGVEFADGEVVDWPGWSQAADGTWVPHDEFDFTRPQVTLTFEVNPEASTVVSYPAATTTCNAPESGTLGVTTTSDVLAAPDTAAVAGVTYRSQVLAVTGSNSWQLAAVGGATVLAGLALVLVAARRSHRTR